MASKRSPLLYGLPEEFHQLPAGPQKLLSEQGRVWPVRRGEMVLRKGAVGIPVIVVRSGLLALTHTLASGERVTYRFYRAKNLVLSSLDPFDVFGGELFSVDISALICWPVEVFQEILLSAPEFHLYITKQLLLMQRQRAFREALVNTLPLESCLAYLLWALADAQPDGSRLLSVRIPQLLLAQYFRVSREEINRKRQLLKQAGYLADTEKGVWLNSACPALFAMQADTDEPWINPYLRVMDPRQP